MALTKTLELDNTGLMNSYRRIKSINSTYDKEGGKKISILLDGYTSKDLRMAMKNHMDRRRVEAPVSEQGTYFTDAVNRTTAYAFLK